MYHYHPYDESRTWRRLLSLLFAVRLVTSGGPVGGGVDAFGREVRTAAFPSRPGTLTVTGRATGHVSVPFGSQQRRRQRRPWLEMIPPLSEQDDDGENDDDDDDDDDPSYNHNNQNYDKDEEALSVIFQRAVVLQRSGISPQQALDEYEFFLKAARQLQRRRRSRSRSSRSGGGDNDSDSDDGGGGGGIIEPFMMAEVYGNQGALYLKLHNYELATLHLQQALSVRPNFGTAHVNLAICELQQLVSNVNVTTTTTTTTMTSMDQEQVQRRRIQCAQDHCQKALECNTDPRSVAMAKKLLQDIQDMKKGWPTDTS